MKLIRTEDAVGHVICHDITRIVKDVTKDAVFRKGHVVTEEDIPVLLSIGKENLYVWEKQEGMLHEDEAAVRLRNLSMGENISSGNVKEGKIELTAECDGVFMIQSELLRKINSIGEIMIASRHGGFPVKKGDRLAGMRVIPLVISEEKLELAEKITGGKKLFDIVPYKQKKAGIVTTGSEVFYGRIKDTFTPVIEEKLAEFGIVNIEHELCNDDNEMITDAINGLLEKGCDFIVCTGGMSVDPDDKTPLAIKNTGADIISYGAPVLPGAMFLLSYNRGNVPILGLPGCVMYAKRTIFDLVLPKLMADIRINKEELEKYGEGGLCLGCEVCTYPNCGFGK